MYLPLVEQVQEVQAVGQVQDEVHVLVWHVPQPEELVVPGEQTPVPVQLFQPFQ